MSEKKLLEKILTETVLTRRSFLKWSAALGGTAALSGGVNLGLKVAQAAPDAANVQVLTTSCYHNCGSRCILLAEVKDGIVTRTLPDPDPVDTFEHHRVIPCLRGRSQKRRVYSAERLKYPMKRVGKRGEGKFERIGWDEALNTVASEMKRIRDAYGNKSFYYQYASGQIAGGIESTYKGSGPICRLMNLFGGYTSFYGSYSAACYGAAAPYITGFGGNSADDLVNSRLVVLFSDNSMVTRQGGGHAGYFYLKAKQAGAKFIVVDPIYTDTAVTLEAEWIPINPGTDVALIAALAYVMVKEDLYDKEFMATHAVGFDEDTLPEDAPPNTSWMAYIMGNGYDKVAKTPEWAASITGIPAERIVTLAREIALIKPCAMLQGWGWQRRAYGEQPVRALPILTSMTGNLGISGGSPGLRVGGVRMNLAKFPAGKNPINILISVYMWPDFIERGHEMTSGSRDRIKGADRLEADMKFMWIWAGNILNQHSDINTTTKLLQDESKLEFIVIADNVMTPTAKFADILLPETTGFEIENIINGNGHGESGNQNFALFNHKLIEPMFECKDVLWIAEQLANRLGLGDEFRDGHNSREDWLREIVTETQKNYPDFPSFDDLKKVGYYKIFSPQPYVAFADFRKDPDANPLSTESGKVQLYSPKLAGLNEPKEIPPIPQYIPEWEGVGDPLRGQYPLMMMGTHWVGRSHSTFDNVDYLRDAHPQTLWINPIDAETRRIKNGDLVTVYNGRGKVHVPAFVTNRIRPGVTNMAQGAWYTPDKNGTDTRGSVNVLTKYHPTPLAKGNPQHTNLVQVEKI